MGRKKSERKRFDPILKEVLGGAVRKIIRLTTGRSPKGRVRELPTELKVVRTLFADALFEVGGEIYQIEVQAREDRALPLRMLRYSFAVRERFGREPVQIVLWVGKGKTPPSTYRSDFTIHRYFVFDVRKADPRVFLSSENPYEVILSVLTGSQKDKPAIVRKAVEKILRMENDQLKVIKYIEKLSLVAGLFDIKVDLSAMGIEIDIRKSFLYKEGREEGIKEGIKEGIREGLIRAIELDIEAKFGRKVLKELSSLIREIKSEEKLMEIKRLLAEGTSADELRKVLTKRKVVRR